MIQTWEPIARARSVLFVPGHRPDRFAKAEHSGADGVVVDLEDAVGPDLKEEARKNVYDWLASGNYGIVRINGFESPWHEADVAMLEGFQCAVMLPKIMSPNQVALLLDHLAEGSCVLPLLETSVSILQAREVLSHPEVIRAVFGTADMGRELEVDYTDPEVLLYARSHIVMASAASGVAPPLDGATAALADEKKLIADARHAAALGFTGRVCLHPRQVAAVNDAFTPSADEVRRAREIISAATSDGSVTAHNDQLIGRPIVERARRLVARAEAFRNARI